MALAPKFRNWLRTLGAPEDPVATDTTSEWSAISLLKAIYSQISTYTVIGTVGVVDNVVPRSNGTGGKTLQSSAMTIDDSGVMSGVTFSKSLISDSGNLTKANDTNVTLTLTGTTTAALLNSIDFALGWTGTLDVTRGGTGSGTATGAATNLGLGTGDSPQFTAVNLGHASDTTLTRTGAGDIAIEGNGVYRAGGTDVPLTDGGTGASSATAARANLEVDYIVTPAMYGGDPTGSSDSATAVQSALDDTTAKIVLFDGMYKVNTGVVISRSDVKVMGAANNWVSGLAGESGLRSNSLIDILTIQGSAAIENITLENFTVHGDGARTGNSVDGIVVGGGGTTVSDGAITAAMTTFTSASSSFTAADVGKNISVNGADTAGGVLRTTIASINSGTSVELTDAAVTTVSGATAYWVFLPQNVTLKGVSVTPINRYGVNVKNCNNFHMFGPGELGGETSPLRLANEFYSDSGDHVLTNCQFDGGSYNIHHISGGGLKMTACKLLNGTHSYFADWTQSISANLTITGCSMENASGAAIRFNPEVGFGRANITGNTILAGQGVLVDSGSTGALESLAITGNTIQTTAASPAIQIGKASHFTIAGNVIDGQGTATVGITIGSGATYGTIERSNEIFDCTARISNSSTTTVDHNLRQHFIPAALVNPAVTNGPARDTAELPTGDVGQSVLLYDATTQESAWSQFYLPHDWDGGDVSVKVYWHHGATATNFGVQWLVGLYAVDNGENLDITGASTGNVSIDDTGGSTNYLYISPSGTITITNTPAAGNLCNVIVRRVAAAGTDTLAVDAALDGVMIEYGVK